MDHPSSLSSTTRRPLSDRLLSATPASMHVDSSTRVLALPGRLRLSASHMPAAPLLRYPCPDPVELSSSSDPPTPLATALNEALSESILPTPPPQARLPPAFSPSCALTRPPLMATVRCTYPTAFLSAAHGSPFSSMTSTQPPIPPPTTSAGSSSRAGSSLDALRSIHMSSSAYFISSQSQSKWWFQLDSEAVKKESVESILHEDDTEGTRKKCM